jgi:hypothetical protein
MDARPDVLLLEQLHEGIPADAQPFQVHLYHIEMTGMLPPRRHIGDSALWDFLESLMIPPRTAPPERPKPVVLSSHLLQSSSSSSYSLFALMFSRHARCKKTYHVTSSASYS